MKQYTREEIIAELTQNVSVLWKGYGTWKIKSYIGQRETYRYCADHYIEVSEITHNEEDKIGIMDGEHYNPLDYDEWLYDYAQYEIEDYEQLNEDELKDLFDEHCQAIWADSTNKDNYEPYESQKQGLLKGCLTLLLKTTESLYAEMDT